MVVRPVAFRIQAEIGKMEPSRVTDGGQVLYLEDKMSGLMSKKVLIIIDALGFELVRRHAFRPEGLSDAVKLETVPGFSQSALTSIMTGVNPDEHELWMMYSFENDGSPFRFIGSVPGMADMSRLWVRRLVNWKLRRLDGVSAYYNLYDVPGTVLPYLDLPARKRLFAPGSVRGRSTILDRAVESGMNVRVWDYETPEDKAFDELKSALKEEGNGFYLLYTAGLDAVMHTTGTGSTETKTNCASMLRGSRSSTVAILFITTMVVGQISGHRV